MKRSILVVAALLLLLGLGAVSAHSGTPYSQQEATYVGMNACYGCHAFLPVGPPEDPFLETPHPNMLRPRDQATVFGQFPVTDANGQTWNLEDVDYVVGAGVAHQFYIKVIDGVWRILPIRWEVATSEWLPFHPDDWMTRDYKATCIGCHVTGYDATIGDFGERYGITCESCHGPGSQHASSGDKTEITKTVDAATCTQCHSHGMRYSESAHATSLDGLKASGHAQDTCLRCHSEDYRRDPENVTLETAQFSITCVTCHTPHSMGTEGTPQLAKAPYDTCVQCHNGDLPESGKFEAGATIHHPMQEMFEGIGFPDLPDIPSRHFTAETGPDCATCHFVTEHALTIAMPGEAMEGEGNSCTSCHTEEEGGKVWLQDVIDRRQADIHTELDVIQAWLDANADQSDTDAYKTAYTAHSMVESEGSFGVHNFAYAKAILGAAKAAIGSPNTLEAVKVSSPPSLDGNVSDAAWADAPELEIPSMDLKMKAVYTDQDLYVLATWADPTFSLVRGGSWIWDGTQWLTTKVGNPEVGPGMSEDRITFMWNMTVPDFDTVGCMSKCHGDNHPGYGVADEAYLDEGNADMWHMKAARSLPATSASQSGTVVVGDDGQPTAGTFTLVGYTDDKWLGEWSADNAPDGGRFGDAGQSSYSNNRNADKTAPMYVETDPADYIDALTLYQSEIDAGEAVEVAGLSAEEANTIWAKYAAVEGRVPERILRESTGSRADVAQAAVWSDGVWTSEFKRALDTGHPDEDVIFDDLTKSYGFGVATMDNTGGLGHKTGGLNLSLVFRAAPAPAEIPAGRDALTARAFIDYRCDRFFQNGLDVALSGVPVTISFPDGSSATAQTTPFGMVYFAGFDASGGLTVSVELPATYGGYELENCPADSTSIDLSPSDFQFGFTSAVFGANVKGETAGP